MTTFWKWFRIAGVIAVALVCLLLVLSAPDNPTPRSADQPSSMFRR